MSRLPVFKKTWGRDGVTVRVAAIAGGTTAEKEGCRSSIKLSGASDGHNVK